jgi:hypothetical protein
MEGVMPLGFADSFNTLAESGTQKKPANTPKVLVSGEDTDIVNNTSLRTR